MSQEQLAGTIERITYHNEENGFAVLKVKAKNHRDLVTVVGSALGIKIGEYVDCHGSFTQNKDYGLQFKASNIIITPPSTLEGIEKYLGSGLIKGIGDHFAKTLVQTFGQNVFTIIDGDPEKLLLVPGIGKSRQELIVASWQAQKMVREIVLFLQKHGLGSSKAGRIFKTYGNKAVELIEADPYRLSLDIHGIGFKTADALAIRLGVDSQSLLRARAGLRYVLQELSSSGHVAAIKDDLLAKASQLLQIDDNILASGLKLELEQNNLVADQEFIYLSGYFRAETGVAKHLKRIMQRPHELLKDIKIDDSITWVEQVNAIKLSKSQKEALSLALQNKVVVITGGPGVGKTTIINSLLRIIRQKTHKVLLAAPTGRAAKRLSETTLMTAKTLHRLLEYDPNNHQFKRNDSNQLDAKWVIIDETSMVDINMMYYLLKAIPDDCGLVLVGDVDQLPSVGPGAVLKNIIDSNAFAVARLGEIFRQASNSQIITNAHRVNAGKFPLVDNKEGGDFFYLEASDSVDLHKKLIAMVSQRIPNKFKLHPVRQIQVLAPMNKGSLGVRTLNIELQQILNKDMSSYLEKFGFKYAVGDKVIQIVNNYDKEVFNGDIGYIERIDLDDKIAYVNFDERIVSYEAEELDELMLAYATTIHKAQGSEYEAIVLPVSTQYYTLLERNLLYTAITRGKKLVVIIGEKKALYMAINTVRAHERVTNLVARLND